MPDKNFLHDLVAYKDEIAALIGAGITDITYADLVTAIGASGLTPGGFYRITDYATVHFIVDSNGTQYLGDIITGVNEPLIVQATSANTIGNQAYSALHPEDVVSYDWDPSHWLDDLSFADLTGAPVIITGFKGVITARHDTLFDNEFGYDFRNCKSRRWKTNVPAWVVGDLVDSTSTNGAPSATSLEDTGTDFILADVQVGDVVTDTTDGSTAVVSGVAQHVLTTSALTGGGGNVYTAGDAYTVVYGLGHVVTYGTEIYESCGAPNTAHQPDISAGFWFPLVDISQFEYQLAAPGAFNGLPADAGSFADFLTFVDNGVGTYAAGLVVQNHFRPFKDNYTFYDSTGTMLPNNVFFLPNDNSYFWIYLNEIGGECAYNTVDASNGFDVNVIGSGFQYNLVGTAFQTNHFGAFVQANIFGVVFEQNACGEVFYGNHTGQSCQNNTFGGTVYRNHLANGFFGNAVETGFQGNYLGLNFGGNMVGSTFQNNHIGSGCAANQFGVNCNSNTISFNFNENATQGNFYSNTIGHDCAHNKFGALCQGNTIGDSCDGNEIGAFFFDNIIPGANFNDCKVAASISSIDFTAATFIYDVGYHKELFRRADGAARLSYFDAGDVLTIVAANA